MAVVRKNRSAPFTVRWTNPFSGVRHSKSFATKTEAKEFDSLVKHRLKFERELFQDEAAPRPEEIVLEELVKAYLDSRRMTPQNMEKMLSHARHFLSAKVRTSDTGTTHPLGHVIVSKLTKKHVSQAVAAQHIAGVKSNTVNRRYSIIRTALQWGEDNGLIETNPVPRFACPRGEDESNPPPTPDEQARLVRAAPPHLQRVIIVGAALGLRVGRSELFGLKWSDFDPAFRTVRVTAARKNPRRPWRELPISEALRPILIGWKSEDDVARQAAAERGETVDGLFEHVVNFRGRQINSVKTAWDRAVKAAGITRRIRPYDLRHAFATYSLANGANLKAVAEVMGHADERMVLKNYQHVLDEQRREVMEKAPLPGLDGGNFGVTFGVTLGSKRGDFADPNEKKIQ